MTVKDDLHNLVNELDDAAAREALIRLQDLRSPQLREEAARAEDAEIDAEYEHAYRQHPIGEDERRVLDAFTSASVRSLYGTPGSRG